MKPETWKIPEMAEMLRLRQMRREQARILLQLPRAFLRIPVLRMAGGAGAASDRSMAEAGAAVTESLVLDFADTDKLAWPVNGNIVLGYSMDTTTYFPTLDQYKVNPANVIQSEVSTPVSAPADARIVSVGTNEEIGNYVDLDFGNGYTAVCGQLKEIPVVENEYVHRGDLLGYVAEPTKYYTVEGTNVFFEFLKDGVPVDALDFLE